jgi:Helix-turn-helix domain
MIKTEKDQALAEANSAAARQPITPRWLKIPAAVAYTGISRSVLYELMNAGKIRSHLIGAARVLDRESLDCFIQDQSVTFPGADRKVGGRQHGSRRRRYKRKVTYLSLINSVLKILIALARQLLDPF